MTTEIKITAQDLLNAVKESRENMRQEFTASNKRDGTRFDNLLEILGKHMESIFDEVKGFRAEQAAYAERLTVLEQMLLDLVAEMQTAKPAPGAGAVAKRAAADGKMQVMQTRTVCPSCGNGVYDNRNDPERGKRPLMKCKSKECNWATWKSAECLVTEADYATQ